MAENRRDDLFKRLTQLFRGGPVLKKKVRSFRQPTATSAVTAFKKSYSQVYSNALNAYGQYDRQCLAGHTLIPVPGKEGFVSIAELAKRYPKDEKFIVYSYDHEKKQIVPAYAHHPRQSGIKDTVKIKFDDDTELICTPDHPCMTRSGEYQDAGSLKAGDSMMPFYRKQFNGTSKDGKQFTGYKNIYTMDPSGWNGWISEHKLIAEWSTKRKVKKGEEHIHHIDYDSENNTPDNLLIMDAKEHLKLHAQDTKQQWIDHREKMIAGIQQAWDEDDGSRRAGVANVNRQPKIREMRRNHWLNNNPSHNPESVAKGAKTRSDWYKVEENKNKHSKTIKHAWAEGRIKSSRNFAEYWKGRSRKSETAKLTIDLIVETGKRIDKPTVLKISDQLNISGATLTRFLDKKDLKWKQFKKDNFRNHKVVSVTPWKKIPVYDMTVDGHENFATNSIVCHNSRYADFAEMEYCLAGDTQIATLDGYKTIKQLSEEYSADDTFYVYAYDHEKKSIVPALGKHARQTRFDHAWKVTFNSGKEIIGTANHRLMKRDGTFCRIDGLSAGDSMMPFYRKSWYGEGKGTDSGTDYRFIYTIANGWQREHKVVAEWASNRQLKEGEVVHHKNFTKFDNNPENLQIMTADEHNRYHRKILNGHKWSPDNQEWINKFKANHSKFMKENNPAERRDITFGKILEICENSEFNLYSLCSKLDTDPNVIKRRLRKNGFKNFETFAAAYSPGWKNNSWDNKGSKNPRYDSSLTFQSVCDTYEDGMQLSLLCEKLDTTAAKVKNRLKNNGYKNFTDFRENYANHKVVSVEYYGEIPLYDLTVDGYKNFATDTVISHNTPEICSALDIFSEETTAVNEKDSSLHIFSENPKIKQLLDELFLDIINVDHNLTAWTRNLCKYGDMFLFNDVHPELGVVNVFPMPVNEVEREEGYDPEEPLAVRFRWVTQGNQILDAWQVSHFRMVGNDAFLPYGSSVLESARRIWRQLILIEDAMLVYRVVRSPERRVFYIDVGTVPTEDIPNYMEAAQTKLKRSQVVDKSSGRVDLRYNPLSVDEDYFIPVRGGETGTKIDTLAGGQHVSDIADVEYIQRKLFSALKVPKAYLGYDESLSSKATLAQEDIRFSRTISKIQRVLISELEKIAQIHLYTHGYEGEDLSDFSLMLSNPSTVAQQQKLELFRTKFEIAGSIPEGLLDRSYIQKEVLSLSDDEIELIEKGRFKDRVLDLKLESEELEDNSPMGGGGGGALGGGGLGGGYEGEDGDGDLPDGLAGDDGGGGEDLDIDDDSGDSGAGEEDLFAGEDHGKRLIVSDDDPNDDEDISLHQALMDDGSEDDDKPRKRKKSVKQSDQLSRYGYNRKRRRTHGPTKTHMPDFSSIVKPDGDPNDLKFFRGSPFSGSLSDAILNDDSLLLAENKTSNMSYEMRVILTSLGKHIDSIKKEMKMPREMLTEYLNVDDIVINDPIFEIDLSDFENESDS